MDPKSLQMEIEQNRPTPATKNQEDRATPALDEAESSPPPIPPHQNGASPNGPGSQNPSPSSDPTPSHMDSPSIQTMGQAQPPGYDPNRIPASIFSAKPANPSEWSVASNESLFSIHMGNNSFSRDYAILYGKSADLQDSQLRMSGELPRLDDWNNNNNNNKQQLKSSELIGLPPVIEESHASPKSSSADGRGLKMENREKTEIETMANDAGGKMDSGDVVSVSGGAHRTDVRKVGPAERLPSNPQTFPSPPWFSDESRNNSGSSFAFPVLVNDHGKPDSLKVVPETPEPPASQAEDSKETANASETRWFSFVVCWPRCC